MFLHVLLLVLSVPALLCAAYLLVLTLLSRAPRRGPHSSRSLRFEVVVPAHDEAAGIVDVIGNLMNLDWPADLYRVVVVADNCRDATAALARTAGACVIERNDTRRRGKGHALAAAFEASRARGWADAVVVVDADSEVSANLLEAFAARIEQGAEVLQAHYVVLNARESWRTRLLTIAMACFHSVRSRARSRMGLSCGVRGNGWCITHALLRRVPYRAFSLAEDIEFGIDLGLAGHRVQYADEARVAAAMVSGEDAARSQRQRWEGGRWALLRSRAMPLIRAALRRPSGVCADLAFDLIMPPLAYVAVNILMLLLVAIPAALYFPGFSPWLWIGVGCALVLVLHVLRGLQLSGLGLRGALDLARAPAFIAWKLVLMLGSRMPAEWIRTGREPR